MALGETVDPHQMLRTWLTQIAMKQLAARREKIRAIQTPADVRQRGREVRESLLRMIGGLPKERSPLNVRRTGVIDRGDYRVEKIIFESSPKEYVTANLYVPQTGKPPYPAVLHPVGHSTAAKVRAFYQTLSLGLVKSGYVVLTYDPPGQGERRLFYDAALQDSKVGGGTLEHSMVGIQSLLAGESVARYMVWDGIRGVDLLVSRPEVDPERIGVAGCSGGGTLTAYLAVLDDRLRAAAPACYITNWEDQLAGTGPQDAEQQFPDFLLNGFNHGDLIIAAAPKPYLMCNTERDFFPIEGARKTYEEVKRIYGRLGMEDRIVWAVGPGGHGMPKNVREAIYGWMNHWLKGTASTQASEPEFQTEYEEILLSTPTGQLSTSLGGENASSLNLKRYASLPPAYKLPQGPADLERLRKDIRRKVLSLTRYQPSTGALGVTEQPPIQRPGYRMTRLTYQADGRIIPALLAVPDTNGSRRKVLLYLDQAGRAESEKPGSDFDQFAQAGYTVLAPEPSGIGETSPKWTSYSDSWFGSDKTTWLALMVGRPLVGIRMDDILRGIDLLSERHLLTNGGCAGFAKGLLAVDLLFAATVDDRLRALDLEGGPVSYGSMARTPIQRRVFDVIIPDILNHMDLPELAAAMAPRPVRLRNLRSPLGVTEPIAKAQREYKFAAEVYQVTGNSKNFDIGLRREDESVPKAYPD